jgi:cytochrome d ubiquinol oxidase subunit I
VFWSFRIMVGIGMLMIATGLTALVLFFRKRLFDARWFHYWCMALTPAGFIAVLAGWFVTEIGRQPYIVYGVLRTAEAASPVPGTSIAISLAAFLIVYGFVFGAGSYYILKLIGKGPVIQEPTYGDHGVGKPPIVTEIAGERGAQHV